jgi:hypothetical protein
MLIFAKAGWDPEFEIEDHSLGLGTPLDQARELSPKVVLNM